MALLPDRGRLVFSEQNVDAPAGLKTSSCYDLTLYPELGSSSRGVLIVTVIASVKFADGVASSGGAKLTWTDSDKKTFISGVQDAVRDAWGEKHRLKTPSSVPSFNDVGVIFDLQMIEGLSSVAHSHWDMTVTKVDKWTQSCVSPLFNTWISNGEAHLDSLDLRPEDKLGPGTQRGAVHEFGHMLGYRDEYPAAAANTSWLTDKGSIMHSSEEIKARHYAFFAEWMNAQYKVAGHLAGEPTYWAVDGTTNLAAALT